MDHGIFHIQCQAEDCTIAYVSREMLVTNTEVGRALRGPVAGRPSRCPVGFRVTATECIDWVIKTNFWKEVAVMVAQRSNCA